MNGFNRAVWFDIPIVDLERTTTFDAQVLNVKAGRASLEDTPFSVFEHADGNGGRLVPKAGEVAADKGILLSVNAHGRLRDAVEKVQSHGGSIIADVPSLGPHGFRTLIIDSEENGLALHSETDQ